METMETPLDPPLALPCGRVTTVKFHYYVIVSINNKCEHVDTYLEQQKAQFYIPISWI